MCVAAYISKKALEKAVERFNLEKARQEYRRVLLEDSVPVVRTQADGGGSPEAVTLIWKATQVMNESNLASFNVRGERIEHNQLWQDSFGSRHCLVFADGFFDKEEVGKTKRYHYFTRRDGQPLALAGMWKPYRHRTFEGEILTIITTAPNDDVADIHDRMPLTLAEADWETWLAAKDRKDLRALVQTPANGELEHWRVTDDLFKRKQPNTPELLTEIHEETQGELF